MSKLVTLGLCVWKVPQQSLDTVLDEALRNEADPNRRKTLTENLMDVADYHLENILAYVVADWFWRDKDGPSADVPHQDVETLIGQLEIDLETEWQQGNILAPRALLDLYDEPGLHQLAKKWKVKIEATWQRTRLIDALEKSITDGQHDDGPECTMPPEVVKAKGK
ncbi:MAG: hypothetical protein ABSE84_09830 [Isosphaeraceae bacterium]